MKRLIAALILSILAIQFATGEKQLIELRAARYSYSPNIIKVNRGDAVTIKLISTDVTHGFFLDGYEINLFAHPGKPQEITFKADKSGRFSFRCSRTCGEFHPYMIGHIKVLPNLTFYAGFLILAILGIFYLLLLLFGKKISNRKLFGIIPLNWRFELTKFRTVRALLKSRWFPFAVIIFNLFIFTWILVSGITGGFSSGNYNIGIMFVWILWWVVLMFILVPLGGRVWCMMCPFPLFGEWLQRGKLLDVGKKKSRGLGKQWPRELRSLWPLTILFLSQLSFPDSLP